MKTEKERAKEVLEERERARKGFAVTNDEGKDPLKKKPGSMEEQEEREDRIADAGLAIGLGMKRSG
jgi:hypothetical protein